MGPFFLVFFLWNVYQNALVLQNLPWKILVAWLYSGIIVLPSVLPSFCLSSHFLGIAALAFLNFGMVLDMSMKLCMIEQESCAWQSWIFWIFLPQKLGKWTKNWPKQGFLSLLKNLVAIFYWICYIMKIHIICCVPAQISYLGKFFVLEI